MSFVNLLGNDVWTEHDIVRRTEAMVRSEFSAEAEAILNRKVNGVAFGLPLSAEDEAEVARFRAVVLGAQMAGVEARADMAKLQAVLDYEVALARLDRPLYEGPDTVLDGEGNETPNPEAVADGLEREAATLVVGQVSEDTLALHALRHPPEPEVVEGEGAPNEA